MAFTGAYKLNVNLTVNDKENPSAPFVDRLAKNMTIDREGAKPGGGLPGMIEIGTVDEVVYSTGDITKLGLVTVENIDPTNFFDLGPDVAGAIAPFVRLKPGESYAFRLVPGITIRGIADTAACRALVKIYED